MNVQRFEGPDMSAVLAQIRRELGPDAIIVSSQAQQHGRLRRRTTIEVIAGLPEPESAPLVGSMEGVAAPRPAREAPRAVPSAIPSLAERLLQESAAPVVTGNDRLEISGAARRAAGQPAPAGNEAAARLQTTAAYGAGPGQPAVMTVPPGAGGMTVPPGAGGEDGDPPGAGGEDGDPLLLAEIRSLREDVARLQQTLQTAGAGTGNGRGEWSDLPRAARALLQRLRAGGASETFVDRTAGAVRATVPPGASPDAARAATLRAVLSLLPNGTNHTLPSGSGAVLLVGPSGAGKTLSAAKLAWAIRQSGGEAVLANADQERPGAGAQVEAYGQALGIPSAQVYDPDDLRALAAAHPRATIVIDTAGRLPDEETLLRHRGLAQATRGTQVLVTIAASSGAAESQRALEAFEALSPAGVIVSKVDEAAGVGAALSVLSDTQLPLLYLSQSADVLQRLEPAGPGTLLERVLQQGREGSRDDAIAS